MITATFGTSNVIAQGNLNSFQKAQPNSSEARMKQQAQQDPMMKLFMNLEYRYKEDFIAPCSFPNKTQIENFDVQAIKANMTIDMSSVDGLAATLKSYGNNVTQSTFGEGDIMAEVNRLLA